MAEKYRIKGTVREQERIGEDIFSMRLAAEEIARAAVPGQFVSVYSNDSSRMLPRPISICRADAERGEIRLVYRVAGKGTGEFSRAEAGDSFDLVGPLGNGFPLERAAGKKAFLIGGGIGIPPILELAARLDCEKQIILGYRDRTFLDRELAEYGRVYIATEDGSTGTKGTVIDCIRENGLEADIIYACGPTPMLRALKAAAAETGTECWLSLEQRMACGVGACLACVCTTTARDEHSQVFNARICAEGPVFLSTDVEL